MDKLTCDCCDKLISTDDISVCYTNYRLCESCGKTYLDLHAAGYFYGISMVEFTESIKDIINKH